ncbi:Uma2 family endonuclease [Thiolinea disciformis]|uniref:Uma2 family endonuclease n=1 Tax=Thiolinea disciformis TaxID=125614 RepID=UPI00035CABEA|nr:Uma2 family endonuclease [Thiolinea disciformis]
MLAQKNDSYLSETEYLEGEKTAKERHEYVDGKVYAMAGASRRHSRIALNIALALRTANKTAPCEIHVADVKVKVSPAKAYYYPDVVVGCESDESDDYYLQKPCLIVEVSSKSTAWKDQHEKVVAYQKLASLQTYLIVAQESVQVTVYFRDATGAWAVALYDALEQVIHLSCPPTELRLLDIYEGVQFD